MRVWFITGASRGFGALIAEAALKAGDAVVATARDPSTVTARLGSHERLLATRLDVTSEAEAHEAAGQAVKRFGRIDILVNDAAYNKSIPFDDLDSLTLDVWDKIMAVNLTGPMRLIKAVAPIMKAQRAGRIVNISSTAGLGPSGSSIAYAVSKAGLIHLTRCFAVGLAPQTLVNCVAPGLLEGTRATANLGPEQIERSTASSLLKQAADKDDCAEMVVTMCRTDTMTGQTVVIDAGRVFH